jgi:hypothetical protein
MSNPPANCRAPKLGIYNGLIPLTVGKPKYSSLKWTLPKVVIFSDSIETTLVEPSDG